MSTASRSSVLWKRKKREGVPRMEQKSCSNHKCSDNSSKNTRPRLISYKELPEYMMDNEFILKYYRADWSIKQAFFSLFRWHNETLNIWTHLIGFALFLFLAVINLLPLPGEMGDFLRHISWSYPLTTWSRDATRDSPEELIMGITSNIMHDLNKDSETHEPYQVVEWPFYVYLVGAMICLILSSICHLFSCHSNSLNITLLKLDYLGITTMIITSYFPAMYYIFLCTPHFQIFYLTMISFLGFLTILTLFTSTKHRIFRTLVFISMGLFGIVPTVHALVVNWNEPGANVTLAYEGCMALSYLVGTFFFVTRIPERFRPGCFDLVGQSHQIFHVLVILGGLAHYGAALIFLEFRRRVGCGH